MVIHVLRPAPVTTPCYDTVVAVATDPDRVIDETDRFVAEWHLSSERFVSITAVQNRTGL